jgi:hypothetical protein
MHSTRAARQAFAKVRQAWRLPAVDYWDRRELSHAGAQARRYALRGRLHEGCRSASALAGVEKVSWQHLGFSLAVQAEMLLWRHCGT